MLSLLRKLLDKKNNTQVIYPLNADGVTVTGAAGAWTWGAWTALAAALPANLGDRQLVAVDVEAASGAGRFEIQIGIGDVGAETNICACRFTATAAVDAGRIVIPSSIQIPQGSRVAARVRSSAGGAQTLDLAAELNAI